MRKVLKGRKGTRGQSLVEFALLLPVFLILVMGVIDIARGYSVLQVVTNAAREGARVGILPTAAPGAVTTSVNTYLTAGGQNGCVTAGANWGNAAPAGVNTTVTVTCNFVTMTGTLIPRMEWNDCACSNGDHAARISLKLKSEGI